MTKPAVIPFYGATNPDLFAIERRAMDRDGRVIAALDALLPSGLVLDVGAGNGFTAAALSNPDRTILPLEPASSMIDRLRPLPWIQGIAQAVPLRDNCLDAAYATWAYFFPIAGYGETGLAELNRVVKTTGPIIVVDNAGGDELCSLFERDIASDGTWWTDRGFETRTIHTSFRFDSLAEAEELLSLYWRANGRRQGSQVRTEIEYAVALYLGHAP